MFSFTCCRWLGVLLLPCFWGLAEAQPSHNELSHRVAHCTNYIQINGKSNVNQFSFNFIKSGFLDRIKPGRHNQEDVVISIPIREFVASNPMMYNDFLVLMKESEHPRIEICFSRKQLNEKGTNDNSCPEIKITIAGVTKFYQIDCAIYRCSGNLFIGGEKSLKLSDFNLTPPEKLNGLVKVKDDILVNFGFIITFTDNNTITQAL